MNEVEKKQLRQNARNLFLQDGLRNGFNGYHFVDELEADLAAFENAGFSFNVLDRLIAPLLVAKERSASVDPSDALLGGVISRPSIAMDDFAKREKRRTYDYPKAPAEAQGNFKLIRNQMTARRIGTKKRKGSPYQSALSRSLSYLEDKGVLPRTIGEAFDGNLCSNPVYFNDMLLPMNPLYAILDGGLADSLSGKSISPSTWYYTLELSLSLCHLTDEDIVDDAEHNDLSQIKDILDQGWPSIICIGILIHTLRLFSSEAHMKLLYQENYAKDEVAAEMKGLRKQVEQLTGERNAANRKVSELRDQLRTQAVIRNQAASKDSVSAELIHDTNVKLKEKDTEISQLQKRIQQLEADRAEQERKAMADAENAMQDKPWLETKLPEDGILFIGGHTNMVKKIRELHPKWTYIDTNEHNNSLPSKVDAIFIWAAHLSHPLWYRINEAYQSREAMLYVSATNIPRLEEEMKYELWKYLNG